MIDPEGGLSDIGGDLPDTESTTSDETRPRPRERRKWRRWVVPVVLAGGLVWLNGPGLRWLVPMVAVHYLEKAGIRGNFALEGNLTGGISVKDLRLEGDQALERFSVGRLTPSYRFRELARGRLDGIAVDGLHAEVRLGLKDGTPEEAEKPLFDLEKLVQTLRMVRDRLLPVAMDFRNVSFKATKEGNPVIALAPSWIHHAADEPAFTLKLGAITDAGGREWPAQESTITWHADELLVDRLAPLPGVAIRNLALRLPASGGPSVEAEILLDDAVLVVGTTAGFSSVRADLREGVVRSQQIAERFALKLPANAVLTSLSLNVDGVLPDPKAATGELRLLLENVMAGGWTVPELSLDAELAVGRVSVAASGQALGSGFSMHAEAPVSREGGKLNPGDVRGHFNVAEVAKLVAGLAVKVKAIDPEAPVPVSMVDGDFQVSMADMKLVVAELDLLLKPADPREVSSVQVKGRWQPDRPISAELVTEGLKAKAEYDLKSTAYDAGLEIGNFATARIDRWLAIVKAGTKGAVSLTGKWQGGGDVKAGKHQGGFSLAQLDLAREGMPPVKAQGEISYDWPAGFEMKGMQVQAKDQLVSLDTKLADGLLEMTNLRWQDRGIDMAVGSARLPVPENFSKWREMLVGDTRPLDFSLESKVLSLALLKDWLPAASKLDPRSTGRLQVKVSGTYAAPVVDAVLEARDLRSPEQPKVPPADLKITIAAKEGRMTVDGRAITPDFAPALLTASMPFRPAAWADNPGCIQAEPVTARLDLPKIDLSRFASLISAARKMSGFVTGNVEVTGEIGKPLVKGKIDLSGCGLELKNESVPPITGAGASVDLTLDRITLSNLKATIAGGTLQGGGSLAITNGKPGVLDFRVTGRHLPLKRDDSLIVRANADLRLAGPWQQAALTGTVGVVDSLFYRDIELLPIGTPFTAPSAAALPKIDAPANPAAAVPEPFRNWTINVLARTENPFLIRGNFATGRVDANLRIGGTVGTPAPDGEVRITDFRAALPFSTLTIRSGTLRFSPATGFDPVLEIRGNAEPRPYQVSVFVYGRASNPQLVLTSSPPLPDNEIMTLLATGTTTSGLENPQAASSRAMQLLAEELRRGRFAVGKQLRPILGLLDRVDFSLAEADPYSNDSFSTATISITDRWFLSAGMGAEGDSRVLAIWRLSFH